MQHIPCHTLHFPSTVTVHPPVTHSSFHSKHPLERVRTGDRKGAEADPEKEQVCCAPNGWEYIQGKEETAELKLKDAKSHNLRSESHKYCYMS